MEDHLGALNLVINAITVWNTKHLQVVLDWLEVIGEAPNPDDLAHLSPLWCEHIHRLDGYPFKLHEDLKWGGLGFPSHPDNLETWPDLEGVA